MRSPRRTQRGRHRASIRLRRRRAALGAVVVLAGAVLAVVLWRGGGIERVCSSPTELGLVSDGNVRLVPEAMDALRQAETSVGHEIDVVQSYRSCREQRLACERICGSRTGCPGLCAPPGLSWHQRGLAIDVTQEMLDEPGVITALEEAGWCHSVPESDPGHFSFDGCH